MSVDLVPMVDLANDESLPRAVAAPSPTTTDDPLGVGMDILCALPDIVTVAPEVRDALRVILQPLEEVRRPFFEMERGVMREDDQILGRRMVPSMVEELEGLERPAVGVLPAMHRAARVLAICQIRADPILVMVELQANHLQIQLWMVY